MINFFKPLISHYYYYYILLIFINHVNTTFLAFTIIFSDIKNKFSHDVKNKDVKNHSCLHYKFYFTYTMLFYLYIFLFMLLKQIISFFF